MMIELIYLGRPIILVSTNTYNFSFRTLYIGTGDLGTGLYFI